MRDDQAVSAAEIAQFDALAPQWWDPAGPMRELHRMNPLRTAWIADRIHAKPGGTPATILDMGCGGGILTESLARAGFTMTGTDGAADAIGVARAHAAASGLDITYRTGLAEDVLAAGDRFDAIAALEIIEHVPDQAAFLRTLSDLLHPGGQLFVSTLNRTWQSLAVAKIGAEYIARLLPTGTHTWRQFVRPPELAAMARAAHLRLTDLSGLLRTPSGTWKLGPQTSINYIAAFTKGSGKHSFFEKKEQKTFSQKPLSEKTPLAGPLSRPPTRSHPKNNHHPRTAS